MSPFDRHVLVVISMEPITVGASFLAVFAVHLEFEEEHFGSDDDDSESTTDEYEESEDDFAAYPEFETAENETAEYATVSVTTSEDKSETP